ncbi:5990_t:CDS:2, partial [Paraglomus brasilianum]
MAASPRQKVNLADSTRSYIKMTENSWNWVTLPTNLQVIKFGNLPQNDTKNFICLSYLGSGAEGLVWLAMTEQGTGCVIKLAKSVRPISSRSNQQELTTAQTQRKDAEAAEHQIASDRLQTEANHWKILWGIDAQVKDIGGQPALVMSYFKICAQDELENNPQIRTAVVNAKKKNGKLQAVFIDLSNVVREQEVDAIADMIMMEKLNLTG